ncbi:glycosyl hydrolase family 18 protein [Lachnobacterium bovis]|uniref:glycosyl hydrolase family 18 protein n=1 Tax=Lachnobacterium bovis TaxID=140626 RepID=UPI0009DE8431|nr:glycosyl hydrolase family 18 protein [Lachnobacterium bovis]
MLIFYILYDIIKKKYKGWKTKMKKIMSKLLIPCAIIFLLVCIFIGIFLYKHFSPNNAHADISKNYGLITDEQVAVILNANFEESQGTLIDGDVYLNYKFIHKNLNSRLYWDSNENKLLYTTNKDLIMVSPDSSNYLVNRTNTNFNKKIVVTSGDNCYINVNFIKKFSNFDYKFYKNPSRIVLTTEFKNLDYCSSEKSTQIRVLGGIKSPILKDLNSGESLRLIKKYDNWSKVMSSDGIIGYVKNSALSDVTKKDLKTNFKKEHFTHKLLNSTINMAWHQVTSPAANSKISSVLASTKKVNVISPTWFSLNDNNGNLKSVASIDYVNYCHKQNIQVWALYSNIENKNVDTSYVLTHTSTRHNLVNQIISQAIQYNIDGINLDFESLNGSKVGDSYIQFVRELSLKCKDNHLILSVDNYTPANYTRFYNIKEQANFADYICIMAYDEHTSGSPSAGSTASYSWVNSGIEKTLNDVPSNQVIMGIPFYSRLWFKPLSNVNDSSDTNGYKIKSTLGLVAMSKLVTDTKTTKKWLSDEGQYYIQYKDNENLYKVWIEDNKSISKKLNIVNKKKLAGAAYWKLGFEDQSTWDTIVKTLKLK